MNEFLNIIDKDIDRCNKILKENNYIEIVIAVEELIDKYKDSITGLVINNDRVWNYSKKDLENLRDKIVLYRKSHIWELMFKSVKSELIDGREVPASKLEEIKYILEMLEKIHYENISKNEKWNKLSNYINWISKEDMVIGTNILRLINIVLNI
ncbi:MAG: hypothetical protein ACRC92_16465 [Peptostreptococcaceae bacterium]